MKKASNEYGNFFQDPENEWKSSFVPCNLNEGFFFFSNHFLISSLSTNILINYIQDLFLISFVFYKQTGKMKMTIF